MNGTSHFRTFSSWWSRLRAVRVPRVPLKGWRMAATAGAVAVAVALVAVMRPYPVWGMSVAGHGVVFWSDGTWTKGAVPVPTDLHGFGPCLRVRWSDGTTNWYVGGSAR